MNIGDTGRTELLQIRLQQIARIVRDSDWGLGLLGLGSAGREDSRLDSYSDLDFFAIVMSEAKPGLLRDCSWLAAAAPVAWQFRNTADGYKLLFEDGIYCEFALFSPEELDDAVYAPGRFIWRYESLDARLELPKNRPSQNADESRNADWLLGEIISCIYVGVCRFRRGETLSAMIFVERHAFSMLLELMLRESPGEDSVQPDRFSPDRRIEFRYPGIEAVLGTFLNGYGKTLQSASAMLEYLTSRWELPAPMVRAVEELIN